MAACCHAYRGDISGGEDNAGHLPAASGRAGDTAGQVPLQNEVRTHEEWLSLVLLFGV